MLAYKFLRTGAVGPFTGFAWPRPTGPTPGPWVHAGGAPSPCRNGIHACQPADLPYWICDELWALELGGAHVDEPYHVVAPSGRLVERIAAWDANAAVAFAHACIWRIRDHAVVALTGVGDVARAAQLGACSRIDELHGVTSATLTAPSGTKRAAATTPDQTGVTDAADVVGYLADAIMFGAAGRANLVAFTAAHVAQRTADAAALERALQASWFHEHILRTNVGVV